MMVTAECHSCGEEFSTQDNEMDIKNRAYPTCPECGSTNCSLNKSEYTDLTRAEWING